MNFQTLYVKLLNLFSQCIENIKLVQQFQRKTYLNLKHIQKEKITDKHLAISITDAVGCLGKGAFSCVRRKTPHTCDDGSIGIADLIGMKYFEEQKS